MEVFQLEYYFVLCCTCLCFLHSMYAYIFVIKNAALDVYPFQGRFNEIMRNVVSCVEYLISINKLVMIGFSLIIFAVYLTKLLNYCSHYIPLSSLYLLWKLDLQEFRI